IGGVVSTALVVRSAALLTNATDLPSGLKTAPRLSPAESWPFVVTLSSVVVPADMLRMKRFSLPGRPAEIWSGLEALSGALAFRSAALLLKTRDWLSGLHNKLGGFPPLAAAG